MRSQKTTAQLRVGVRRKRVRFHQVGDEADCRLQQGVEAVEKPALLRSQNAPSALVNQARGFAVQNGGSLTALFAAGGASSCSGISMLRVLS
jgi:hypothetical protein